MSKNDFFISFLKNFQDSDRVLVTFCEDSMGRSLSISCRMRQNLDDIIFEVTRSEKEKEIMSKYKISVGDENCFTFSINTNYIFGMSDQTFSRSGGSFQHIRIGLTEEAWADFNSSPMNRWIFGR